MSLDYGQDAPLSYTGPSNPSGQGYANTGGAGFDPTYYTSNPAYQGVMQQLGVPSQQQYDYQRSLLDADLAYNKALMGIGGGGGGSNPILDDLRRQGNEADRSLIGTQIDLANKGLSVTDAINQLQLKGYDTQSAINLLGLQSLGISGQQLKNQGVGINLKDALIGLQQQGNQLDKGDVESALRTLGLSRQQLGLQGSQLDIQGQQLGLQNQGLDYTLQQLGLNRGAAQQSAATQLRNLKSDAIARGGAQSEGYGADVGDVNQNLTRALGQIGIQESQVGLQRQDLGLQQQGLGLQRQDLGLQGQKLDEQQGGYQRDLQRLGLNDQQYDINRQQNQVDRQDLQYQMQKNGIQVDVSKLQDSDVQRLKDILGLQNQQAHYDTYGQLAQYNNALKKLELDDQGIGQGVGGGGGSALGAQALAGIQRTQAQIDALNQQQIGGTQSVIQQLQQNPALAGQLFGQLFGVPGQQSPSGYPGFTNYPTSTYRDPNTNQLIPGAYNPNYMSPLGGGGYLQ